MAALSFLPGRPVRAAASALPCTPRRSFALASAGRTGPGKFTRTNADGRWDVVSGSGKYTGVTSGGPYGPVGQFPQPVAGTLQHCNRITGTWKMR